MSFDLGLKQKKIMNDFHCERQLNRDIPRLEIKKIVRSPSGNELEKYSRQMQILSRQFV